MDALPDTDLTRHVAATPGDEAALEQLFDVLYGELHDIARRQRRRWHGHSTLGTTALLHEAYLKLSEHSGLRVGSRDHFYALAARAMRHILCNYARDRRALKRGGGAAALTLDTDVAAAMDDASAEQLAALDEALNRLDAIDPRQGRVVECRFFGGLSVEETAEALGISPRTVKRDWAMAQAWLRREMRGA